MERHGSAEQICWIATLIQESFVVCKLFNKPGFFYFSLPLLLKEPECLRHKLFNCHLSLKDLKDNQSYNTDHKHVNSNVTSLVMENRLIRKDLDYNYCYVSMFYTHGHMWWIKLAVIYECFFSHLQG